jgi:uncharacterized membrane protein YhaH (DUF805 family)
MSLTKDFLRMHQSLNWSKGIKLDIATVIVWIKISVVFYLLTVLAIVDIVRKDFGTIGKKALWGIIAMIPFIGWLIYLIFGFRKGKKPVREDL